MHETKISPLYPENNSHELQSAQQLMLYDDGGDDNNDAQQHSSAAQESLKRLIFSANTSIRVPTYPKKVSPDKSEMNTLITAVNQVEEETSAVEAIQPNNISKIDTSGNAAKSMVIKRIASIVKLLVPCYKLSENSRYQVEYSINTLKIADLRNILRDIGYEHGVSGLKKVQLIKILMDFVIEPLLKLDFNKYGILSDKINSHISPVYRKMPIYRQIEFELDVIESNSHHSFFSPIQAIPYNFHKILTQLSVPYIHYSQHPDNLTVVFCLDVRKHLETLKEELKGDTKIFLYRQQIDDSEKPMAFLPFSRFARNVSTSYYNPENIHTTIIDITNCAVRSLNAKQEKFMVRVSFSVDENKKFIIIPVLVKINAVSEWLTSNLASISRIPKASILKKYFNNQEISEIEETNVSVSLSCPFSKIRITLPSKSILCTHLQCFELSLFVKCYASRRQYECPICGIQFDIAALAVDEFFQEIITAAPDGIDNVMILPDGSFLFPSPQEVKLAKNKDEAQNSTQSKSFFISDDSHDDDIDINSVHHNFVFPTQKEPEEHANKRLQLTSKYDIEVIEIDD